MMREKLPLSDTAIARCLEQEYGLTDVAVTFLPLGYDPNAAVYRVDRRDGVSYFLKITRNAIPPASLQIPRILNDHGIKNVLAPLPTRGADLWCALNPYNVILYPFISGENAMRRGMTDQQWKTFGAALNAIHGSGIERKLVGVVPVETFATPVIEFVRSQLAHIQTEQFELPVQQDFAVFWRQNAALIRHLTERTQRLGNTLQSQKLETVLCHGDAHAANIMLDQSGNLYLVDWDTPRIAPRERDLLFVAGSIIARRVTKHEETCFFAGYGATEVNWEALTYYRYERALEDVYEGGRSVFFNPLTSRAVKEADAQLTMRLFEPGDIVEAALEADAQLGH